MDRLHVYPEIVIQNEMRRKRFQGNFPFPPERNSFSKRTKREKKKKQNVIKITGDDCIFILNRSTKTNFVGRKVENID